MAEFQVYNPHTKVKGQVMLDNIRAIGRRAQPIVAKYGADKLDPNEWYPQQTWLDILRELSHDGVLDLMALGNRLAENFRMPDGEYSVPKLLNYMDEDYQKSHRNVGPVHFTIEVLGPRAVRIIDNSPYPDDLQFGLIFGLLDRLMPLDANLKVRYDRSLPCRSNGADETAYVVTW